MAFLDQTASGNDNPLLPARRVDGPPEHQPLNGARDAQTRDRATNPKLPGSACSAREIRGTRAGSKKGEAPIPLEAGERAHLIAGENSEEHHDRRNLKGAGE